jgi:hypothetical protein
MASTTLLSMPLPGRPGGMSATALMTALSSRAGATTDGSRNPASTTESDQSGGDFAPGVVTLIERGQHFEIGEMPNHSRQGKHPLGERMTTDENLLGIYRHDLPNHQEAIL